MAEIVHDIDLKDGKFNRLEAAGVNATGRGLSSLLKDDRKLLGQCLVIFDGLYELLRGKDGKGTRESDDDNKQGRGRRSSGKRKKRA